jgi:phosphoglycerate dehydrogenase-like enzyme
MKVLLATSRSSDMSSRLKDMIPNDIEIIVPKKGTEEELMQLASDVEVIVCVSLSKKVAQAAKNLKLVQKTGAGVDAIPIDDLGDEVMVANTSGADPLQLAEGAVALVLALAKKIVQRHNLFPQSDSTTRRGIELRGKTQPKIYLRNYIHS